LAIGLLLGLLAQVTSQEGLDGSLVLAGIVHYPPQSLMNQYFLGSWTIIHQLGALLLRAGGGDVRARRARSAPNRKPCGLLLASPRETEAAVVLSGA
jgi:hypothetical protein